MKCPNCSHLMLKGNLAEGCWQCNTCKARFFILQTHAPLENKSDHIPRLIYEKIIKILDEDEVYVTSQRFNDTSLAIAEAILAAYEETL